MDSAFGWTWTWMGLIMSSKGVGKWKRGGSAKCSVDPSNMVLILLAFTFWPSRYNSLSRFASSWNVTQLHVQHVDYQYHNGTCEHISFYNVFTIPLSLSPLESISNQNPSIRAHHLWEAHDIPSSLRFFIPGLYPSESQIDWSNSHRQYEVDPIRIVAIKHCMYFSSAVDWNCSSPRCCTVDCWCDSPTCHTAVRLESFDRQRSSIAPSSNLACQQKWSNAEDWTDLDAQSVDGERLQFLLGNQNTARTCELLELLWSHWDNECREDRANSSWYNRYIGRGNKFQKNMWFFHQENQIWRMEDERIRRRPQRVHHQKATRSRNPQRNLCVHKWRLSYSNYQNCWVLNKRRFSRYLTFHPLIQHSHISKSPNWHPIQMMIIGDIHRETLHIAYRLIYMQEAKTTLFANVRKSDHATDLGFNDIT